MESLSAISPDITALSHEVDLEAITWIDALHDHRQFIFQQLQAFKFHFSINIFHYML